MHTIHFTDFTVRDETRLLSVYTQQCNFLSIINLNITKKYGTSFREKPFVVPGKRTARGQMFGVTLFCYARYAGISD